MHMYVCACVCIHTHTHTHTYIYIHIYRHQPRTCGHTCSSASLSSLGRTLDNRFLMLAKSFSRHKNNVFWKTYLKEFFWKSKMSCRPPWQIYHDILEFSRWSLVRNTVFPGGTNVLTRWATRCQTTWERSLFNATFRLTSSSRPTRCSTASAPPSRCVAFVSLNLNHLWACQHDAKAKEHLHAFSVCLGLFSVCLGLYRHVYTYTHTQTHAHTCTHTHRRTYCQRHGCMKTRSRRRHTS
jgi:hypothetical protein